MTHRAKGQGDQTNTLTSPGGDTASQVPHDFDFSQIHFESDSMQVLSLSRSSNHVEFPLTQGPINFSVFRSDGLLSNRWGVRTNKNGDAYVYRRDAPHAEKVSLHASGRQHIAITSQTAARVGADSRFGPIWTEPEFERKAIATFSLLFPPWGVGMPPEPTMQTKDELWIVGHKEKIVVVSFFVVDSVKEMRGQLPHFVLGRLRLLPGRTLHVIAWKEPQTALMNQIRNVLPQVSRSFPEPASLGEKDYALCLQGYRGPNSAFMVTVPVHYTPRSETS